MKITFLLPYAGMNGGIRVVAIYAQLLRERGHEVSVISVTKKPMSLRKTLRYIINQKKWPYSRKRQGETYLDKNDPWWTILSHAGPITDNDLPDADIVIATWWKTAEWANCLSQRKGIKVYFCQGYETHNIQYRKRAEETYQLQMKKICVSHWVSKKIKNLNGKDDQNIVTNGVDLKLFYQSMETTRDRRCFGFMYSADNIKGIDIILEALLLARKKDPRIRAVAFGSSPPSKHLLLPEWIDFYESPPQESIREIYSKCSAWLFGSRSEGFGLPILEAMACRTPVIATPAGAAPDLVTESCGFIIPHENSSAMAEKILSISTLHPAGWKSLSKSAYKVAQSNNWNDAVIKFEKILTDVK